MDIALFSPSSLFGESDDEEKKDDHQNFVERKHQFPSMVQFLPALDDEGIRIIEKYCNSSNIDEVQIENILLGIIWHHGSFVPEKSELIVREFSFHQLNANLLWPGTFAFAEWLVQHRSWMDGRRVLELGSGTGALAIFLHKSFQLDITTSDYDDLDIEENIAYNCGLNGVTPILPHIRHSWGDIFPTQSPDWDLVIASDILLYVKQYPNLIKTLSFLLNSYKPKAGEEVSSDSCLLPRPVFLMSWRRRIGKDDESLFFDGCDKAGLEVQHLGSRVYSIAPRKMSNQEIAAQT